MAGTSVTEMIAVPISAKVLVKASGWNSLPSWPVSAKTGRNEMHHDHDGEEDRPPHLAAGADDDLRRVARDLVRRRSAAVRRCVAFSSITMAWSTRMPMEMAMPESDMMFDEMPR